MCRLLGKKFSFVGIIISVHVLNKSRGFEMHWVGGGVKVHRGQYPQFNNQIYFVSVVIFFSSIVIEVCENLCVQ